MRCKQVFPILAITLVGAAALGAQITTTLTCREEAGSEPQQGTCDVHIAIDGKRPRYGDVRKIEWSKTSGLIVIDSPIAELNTQATWGCWNREEDHNERVTVRVEYPIEFGTLIHTKSREILCRGTAPPSDDRDCSPEPNRPDSCGWSPILLDLDRNNFHLSSGPASFDIDADGEAESLTWTKAGQLDGFLYLDRNLNGVVDDGGELFGNHTELEDGTKAPHGYIALAEFDDNGDALIDEADSVFDDLRVWVDYNADGVFLAEESRSLAEVGVVTIGLDYMELPRTDPHGNQFKYNGRAWIEDNGKTFKTWTTDVFFREHAD